MISPRCGRPMTRYEASNGPMPDQPVCARPEGHAGSCRSGAALARQYAADAIRIAAVRHQIGWQYGRPGLARKATSRMIPVAYLDACPECPPGIPPASPALGVPEQVSGGVVTAHQCEVCEMAWSASWRDGWVIDRTVAPVACSSGWPAARTEAA